MPKENPPIGKSYKPPQEQLNEWHEEALEINKLVDEIVERDRSISPQQAAEIIIAEKKFEHLEKETQKNFGRGWGEEMQRQIIAMHPSVKRVEQAHPSSYYNLEQKTDAFVELDKGTIAVQLTLTGFAENGKSDLNGKFNDMLKEQFGYVTYRGKKETPLTMSRGVLGEFFLAYEAWRMAQKPGAQPESSPIEYIPASRRHKLANEFLLMMAKVFEWKHIKLGNPVFKEWAEYLKKIYETRALELNELKAAALRRGR